MATARPPGRVPRHTPSDVLVAFRAIVARDGYAPTVREIAIVLGYRGPRVVHAHLRRLVELGSLFRDDMGRLRLVPRGEHTCATCGGEKR